MDQVMIDQPHSANATTVSGLTPYNVRVMSLEPTFFDNGRSGQLVTVGCYRETGTVILYDDKGPNSYRGDDLNSGDCIQGMFYRSPDNNESSVLVRGAQLPEVLIGPELIPSACAANPQKLANLVDLIAQVQHSELRLFTRGVFAEPEVWQKYCLIPSSRRHHHNFLGGNLHHSLQVVEFASSWKQFDQPIERDLLIVGGLLHDLGKVAVYRADGSLTETGYQADHEQLTIEMLGRHLPKLKDNSSAFDLAHVVRNLVQIRRCKGNYPKSLLQQAIYHADCLSAAHDKFHQAFKSKPDHHYWAANDQGEKWLRYPKVSLPPSHPSINQPER